MTFALADAEYGVDISRVVRFIADRTLSRIPNAPSFVKGVLSLEGTLVPVVDLRQKLGLEAVQVHKCRVIIIFEVGKRTMGAVVDAVGDVISLRDTDIEPLQTGFDASIRTECIAGMFERDDGFFILLDLDEVFDVDPG